MCNRFSLPPARNIRHDHANSARAERYTPSFHTLRGSLHPRPVDYSNFYRVLRLDAHSIRNRIARNRNRNFEEVLRKKHDITFFVRNFVRSKHQNSIFVRLCDFLKTTGSETNNRKRKNGIRVCRLMRLVSRFLGSGTLLWRLLVSEKSITIFFASCNAYDSVRKMDFLRSETSFNLSFFNIRIFET